MWVGEGEVKDRVGWLDGEAAVVGSRGYHRVGRGREGGRDETPAEGKAVVGLSEKTRVGQVVQGMKKGSTVLAQQ